jgi:4,5-dihydroxyphthalate decarboxylase
MPLEQGDMPGDTMLDAQAGAAAPEKIRLKTLLQDKPWNAPLKNGSIKSELMELDFRDVEEVSDEFKPMVRHLAYDCGELAIVTYLHARSYGKALVLLPLVVSGNFHHKSFAYNAEKGTVTPSTFAGRRRASTSTIRSATSMPFRGSPTRTGT